MYIILRYKLILSLVSFTPIVLELISDLIAAYTFYGDMQPPTLANRVFEEENYLNSS